jgi:hypothetical protein
VYANGLAWRAQCRRRVPRDQRDQACKFVGLASTVLAPPVTALPSAVRARTGSRYRERPQDWLINTCLKRIDSMRSRVYIPKPGRGERPLGPTIRDRVVQTAAKLVLEPIFEADFEDNAYGYRPARGRWTRSRKCTGTSAGARMSRLIARAGRAHERSFVRRCEVVR